MLICFCGWVRFKRTRRFGGWDMTAEVVVELTGNAGEGSTDGFFRAVLDGLAAQIAVLNQRGEIVFVNRTWRSVAQSNGVAPEFDWTGQNYLGVCRSATRCGDADAASVADALEDLISGRAETFYHEYPCHTPDEKQWFILKGARVLFSGAAYVVLSHHNITRRKLSEQAAEHFAHHDPLTSLANRRGFQTFLARAWRRARRAVSPISVLIVDLDSFKAFNDSLGHLEGDQALVRVGAVLAACARRETDLAARFGGDEFVLVMPDTDAAGAETVARRIVDEVDRLNLVSPGGVQVRASVGLASRVPEQAQDCPDRHALLQLADDALYKVKDSGGGSVRRG